MPESHEDKGYFLYMLQNKGNICIFKAVVICLVKFPDNPIPLIADYSFW